jgi:4-hydroxybenzoate polyprenyltransferase
MGLLNASYIVAMFLGFICFSLASSIVYILNDIRDIEKDRFHSVKCHRPLASGIIPLSNAVAVIVVLSFALVALLVISRLLGGDLYNHAAVGLLLLYVLLNIGYSCGLKNIPIIDIAVLASGYVIRVIFGALIIGVNISVWLCLVVTMGAFYLGMGKRRNELTGNEKGRREVMRFYTHNFLDKNMYVCQALCVVFYAFWSIDSTTIEKFNTSAFVYTTPFILIILLKYSLNIETETETDGDPTSVILLDKPLLFLCMAYIICAFCIVFFNRTVT